jgi:hypothetical protein
LLPLQTDVARIIISSYAVRFPVGGYMSWVLQWLVGFQRLGHDVYFVEKCSRPNACYNPQTAQRTGDCSYGINVLDRLLCEFGLAGRWSVADIDGRHYGLSRESIAAQFRSADLFVDLGLAHDEWSQEAAAAALRVIVDSDPGFTQILWEQCLAEGEALPSYDFHYSVGRNVGTRSSTAPTAGLSWRGICNPVNVDLFPLRAVTREAPFTTIMTWQGRGTRFNGVAYGSKDVEFAKFFDLPRLTTTPLEIAVAGSNVPVERLATAGWKIRNSVAVTGSFDAFRCYIAQSRGEFSVAKQAYVATNSGWFSDRGAAYLASGRPVVMQDTGFSMHLPCGEGLFAVRTAEEAAGAIDEIDRDWERHSRAARDIARQFLDAPKVLGNFLREIGVSTG